MHLKPILVGAAVSAGVAGIAFGGSAVSTAFSADSNGTVTASARTISIATDGMNSMSIADLAPGDSQTSAPFTVDTTGSTGQADLYLTNVGWTVIRPGTGGDPLQSDITVTVKDVSRGNAPIYSAPLTVLQQGPKLLLAKVPHVNEQFTVTFALSPAAGNHWNGAQVQVPFTLHLQSAGAPTPSA